MPTPHPISNRSPRATRLRQVRWQSSSRGLDGQHFHLCIIGSTVAIPPCSATPDRRAKTKTPEAICPLNMPEATSAHCLWRSPLVSPIGPHGLSSRFDRDGARHRITQRVDARRCARCTAIPSRGRSARDSDRSTDRGLLHFRHRLQILERFQSINLESSARELHCPDGSGKPGVVPRDPGHVRRCHPH